MQFTFVRNNTLPVINYIVVLDCLAWRTLCLCNDVDLSLFLSIAYYEHETCQILPLVPTAIGE